MRYALGPLRPAPKEGRGWIFAAGELAMTAEDLAKWDISIIGRSLMRPASYAELEREAVLKNGLGVQYGLGVDVLSEGGHRTLAHGGEVSGFTAENVTLPDDGAAVVVLTNQDAVTVAADIARKVAPILVVNPDPTAPAKLEQAKGILAGLQAGTLDHSLFTANGNSYFTGDAVAAFQSSLAPLGAAQEFTQVTQEGRGGMVLRIYRAKLAQKTLRIWTYEQPDGKLEQYMVVVEGD
jgi:hypothetical protein